MYARSVLRNMAWPCASMGNWSGLTTFTFTVDVTLVTGLDYGVDRCGRLGVQLHGSATDYSLYRSLDLPATVLPQFAWHVEFLWNVCDSGPIGLLPGESYLNRNDEPAGSKASRLWNVVHNDLLFLINSQHVRIIHKLSQTKMAVACSLVSVLEIKRYLQCSSADCNFVLSLKLFVPK
jgi:hypothetical protein